MIQGEGVRVLKSCSWSLKWLKAQNQVRKQAQEKQAQNQTRT